LKYRGDKDGEKREITQKRLVGDFIFLNRKTFPFFKIPQEVPKNSVSGFQDSTASTKEKRFQFSRYQRKMFPIFKIPQEVPNKSVSGFQDSTGSTKEKRFRFSRYHRKCPIVFLVKMD
jgi:hypothetical protein